MGSERIDLHALIFLMWLVCHLTYGFLFILLNPLEAGQSACANHCMHIDSCSLCWGLVRHDQGLHDLIVDDTHHPLIIKHSLSCRQQKQDENCGKKPLQALIYHKVLNALVSQQDCKPVNAMHTLNLSTERQGQCWFSTTSSQIKRTKNATSSIQPGWLPPHAITPHFETCLLSLLTRHYQFKWMHCKLCLAETCQIELCMSCSKSIIVILGQYIISESNCQCEWRLAKLNPAWIC